MGQTQNLQKQTLHEILLDAWELKKEIVESGGELSKAMESLLQINKNNFQKKMEGYQKMIEKLKASQEGMQREAEYYKSLALGCLDKSKQIEKDIERMEARMLFALKEINGGEKLKTENYQFSIRRSESVSVWENSGLNLKGAKYKAELEVQGSSSWDEVVNAVFSREDADEFYPNGIEPESAGQAAIVLKMLLQRVLEENKLNKVFEISKMQVVPDKSQLKKMLKDYEKNQQRLSEEDKENPIDVIGAQIEVKEKLVVKR